MRLNKEEHEDILLLLGLRHAFKDGYEDGPYRYFCTVNRDTADVACQLRTNAGYFNILYNTFNSSLEVDKMCDTATAEFLQHLRNKYFETVDRDYMEKHPDNVYYQIENKIIKLDGKMRKLWGIYPGADASTRIGGQGFLWIM